MSGKRKYEAGSSSDHKMPLQKKKDETVYSAQGRFFRTWLHLVDDRFEHFNVLVQRRRGGETVYSRHDYNTLQLLPGSSTEDRFHFDVPGNFEIVAVCRGIFCLADRNQDTDAGVSRIILWNPHTLQCRILPESGIAPRLYAGFTSTVERIGFGVDVETNDFKVVRTLLCFEDITEVYRFSENAWTRLADGEAHDLPHYVRSALPHENAGSECHWVGEDADGDIMVRWFNMNLEAFESHSFQPPPDLTPTSSMEAMSIVKDAGLLMYSDPAIHDLHAANQIGIWGATDFAAPNSKFVKTFTIPEMDCLQPVDCMNRRCFVQRKEDNSLISVAVQSGDIQPPWFRIEGDWNSFKVFPYRPSQFQLA